MKKPMKSGIFPKFSPERKKESGNNGIAGLKKEVSLKLNASFWVFGFPFILLAGVLLQTGCGSDTTQIVSPGQTPPSVTISSSSSSISTTASSTSSNQPENNVTDLNGEEIADATAATSTAIPETTSPPTGVQATATVPNATDSMIILGDGRFGGPPMANMPAQTRWEFGPRNLGNGVRMHYGIDIACPTGTQLKAMGDGVVTRVGTHPGSGNYIAIRYDNGVESMFYHCQVVTARRGQRVSMGDNVAKADNTGISRGSHLHLEMRVNGRKIDPRRVPGINLPAPRTKPAYRSRE